MGRYRRIQVRIDPKLELPVPVSITSWDAKRDSMDGSKAADRSQPERDIEFSDILFTTMPVFPSCYLSFAMRTYVT